MLTLRQQAERGVAYADFLSFHPIYEVFGKVREPSTGFSSLKIVSEILSLGTRMAPNRLWKGVGSCVCTSVGVNSTLPEISLTPAYHCHNRSTKHHYA